MKRVFPSWMFILLTIVSGLHLAYAGTPPAQKSPQPAPAPPGMILIPGGTFMMGCTKGYDCGDKEKPTHRVSVQSFYLNKTEVTVGLYHKCVQADKCRSIPCNSGQEGREDHPVNCVDWNQAKAYCEWIGGRLPSEAEWEYAARGGHSDWGFPWGNEVADCSRAVMNDGVNGCGKDSTWSVGAKGTYGFGLSDMAGNVSEWVEDCWHNGYRGAPTDGAAWIKGDCSKRVLRGGSWFDDDPWLHSVSSRWFGNLNDWFDDCGFRCAKSVQ